MLVFVMVMCMKNTAFAGETFDGFVNLSTDCPVQGGVSFYGTDRPSASDYVNLNNEALEFSGEANTVILYSNKCFTGKSAISYEITNDSSSRLTVKFYDTENWFGLSCDEIIVEANSTIKGTRNGFEKDHYYYMSFSKPCKGKVY